jgi:hypothetical protein
MSKINIKKSLSFLCLYSLVFNLFIFQDFNLYATDINTENKKIELKNTTRIEKKDYAENRLIIKYKDSINIKPNLLTLQSKTTSNNLKKIENLNKVNI